MNSQARVSQEAALDSVSPVLLWGFSTPTGTVAAFSAVCWAAVVRTAQLGQALNALAEKDAKIAELTAMRYSDNQDAAVYKQTLADNKTLRDEMYAYITPIAQESAANRERVAVLEAQQKCEAEKAQLREQIITQKIDRVASDCACGLSNLSAEVGSIKARVNAITKEVVPFSAICPQPMPRYNEWVSPAGATQVTVSNPARTATAQ